eukprot:SM000078S22118  [mRNA]  locus=s78:479534:486286:+ [translate_table: standard]
MRFDFAVNGSDYGAGSSSGSPWVGSLPIFQQLVQHGKHPAALFKFVADPPTTSLQRLKGLTTGGLPTFVDVGDSFGAPAITEDNLISQLKRRGKKLELLGDDTWMSLFPDHFYRARPFPSFNVKDFNTVDDGILSEIFPAMVRSDWDVIIAHFLGVDHVGHTYAVDSPIMLQKLRQMNKMVEDVVATMEADYPLHQDTLLIVMGDHAQTLTGDHGGGTPQETDSALFALRLSSNGKAPFDMALEQLCGEAAAEISLFPQLDFAATLATLLGVPIPFGSVGKVNAKLWALSAAMYDSTDGPLSNLSSKKDEVAIDRLRELAKVLHLNSWQVLRYLGAYSEVSVTPFPVQQLQLLYGDLASCWPQDEDQVAEPADMRKSLEAVIDQHVTYLMAAAALARSKWTQFGILKMWGGIALLLLSLAVQASCLQHQLVSSDADSDSGRPPSHQGWLTAVFFFAILHALSLFSNSFIVAEGQVTAFLLASRALLLLRQALLTKSGTRQALVIIAVNYLFNVVGLAPSEEATPSTPALSSFRKPSLVGVLCATFLYFGPFAAILIILRLYMVKKGSAIRQLKWIWTLAVPALYAAVCVSWLAEDVKTIVPNLPRRLMEFCRLGLPRAVYLASAAAMTYTVASAILPFQGNGPPAQKQPPTLQEALPAHLWTMCATLSGLFSLLLGRRGPLLLFLGAIQAINLHQFFKLHAKYAGREFFPAMGVDWSLQIVQVFFGTGHRCSFDGLHFNAAYTGFDDFNYYIMGSLLALETFGSMHLPTLLLSLALVPQASQMATLRSAVPGFENEESGLFIHNLFQAVLAFGFAGTMSTLATTISAFLQRRHLMVWALFGPKYVFDAVGLLVLDVVLLASTGFVVTVAQQP